MPVVKGRTTANKTITLPTGGTVLVPVITQLNVVDSTDRYQETDYTIINDYYDPTTNQPTHRQTHVDQIDETGNIDNSQPFPPGDTSLLPVERVDKWVILDPVDRAQETDVTLYNDQANYDPNGPPFFTRHKASHVVRVQNDPDDGNYVDVELIDELDWLDGSDRGQETDLQLSQPQGTYDSNSGMYVITADPSDPDITDTSGNIDPAWRLDPFQNIVGYAGGSISAFCWAEQYSFTDYINTQNTDPNQFRLQASYDVATKQSVAYPGLTVIPKKSGPMNGQFSANGALAYQTADWTNNTSSLGYRLWVVHVDSPVPGPQTFWVDSPPYTHPPRDNYVIDAGPAQGYAWTLSPTAGPYTLTVTMPGGSPSWTRTSPNSFYWVWMPRNHLLLNVGGQWIEYDTTGTQVRAHSYIGSNAPYIDQAGNVFVSGSGWLNKYDNSGTGKLLWSCTDPNLLSGGGPIVGGKTVYFLSGQTDSNGNQAFQGQGIDADTGVIKWTSPLSNIFGRSIGSANINSPGNFTPDSRYSGAICVDPAGNVYGNTNSEAVGLEGSDPANNIFFYEVAGIFSYDENGNLRFATLCTEGIEWIDISKDYIAVNFYSGGAAFQTPGYGNTSNPNGFYGGHLISQLVKDSQGDYWLPNAVTGPISNITWTSPRFGILPEDPTWNTYIEQGYDPRDLVAAQPQHSTKL